MERLGKVSIANSILVEKCPIAKLTKKNLFFGLQKNSKWESRFLEKMLVLYRTKTILYYSFG